MDDFNNDLTDFHNGIEDMDALAADMDDDDLAADLAACDAWEDEQDGILEMGSM